MGQNAQNHECTMAEFKQMNTVCNQNPSKIQNVCITLESSLVGGPLLFT